MALYLRANVLRFIPALFVLAVLHVQAREWKKITDSNELRELIRDQVFDGKYWVFYFRQDGKMAYLQNNFVSFREWNIKRGGELCMNVYEMPDRIIDCLTVYRSTTEPAKYRIDATTGKNIVDLRTPSKELVDALTERAGSQ